MSKNKLVILVIIVILNFAIDRLTKLYIINFFIKNTHLKEFYYNDFINFILVWNKGVAFGILAFENLLYNFFSFVILGIITFIIFLAYVAQSNYLCFIYSIIAGGALGNLFDRFYYGLVPDFIDIHYGDFHWFTFNFADISITIGIFLLLFYEISFKSAENISNENK